MKIAAFILLVFFCNGATAQSENEVIEKPINTFFAGMKSNDTTVINSVVDSSCLLYSIMQTKEGKAVLENDKRSHFLKQIAALKGKNIDEQPLGFDIKIDGAMAIVWVPYKLFFNNQLYHCGVDVFTLINRGDDWKIMGITDTRRKNNCD